VNDASSLTGRLGHRETALLLIVVLDARIFLGLPRAMAEIGGTASWLVVSVACAVALLAYLLLDALLARFPGDDLIAIAQHVAGPLTMPIGLTFFAFFLAITANIIRLFAETFVIGILPHTPIGTIAGFLLVLLVLAGYFGLEAITRLAMLYAPYIFFFLLLIFVSVAPNANPLNLTPIWGSGLTAIVRDSLPRSSIFAELVLMGFLAPMLREQSRRRWVGLMALIASYLVMVLNAVVYTMVFDYPGTARLVFPIYQLTRLIALMEFFQRVEAVFVFLWFFTAAIALSALFYAVAYTFTRTFALSTHRPILFPMAVIVYAISLLPGSFAQVARFDADFIRVYGWMPAFLLPAILLGLAILRGKKGRTNP